jgi:putative (di)nucleoside polyphosphate hydrolase
MRFTGKDSDIDLHAHEPEFSSWKWLAIAELPQVIVPFKRDSYAKVVAALGHLAKPE